MTSQLSKFGSYSKEDAAKGRQEESSTGWLKLKSGTNIIRIMPPLVGMSEPWVTIFQHFIKVPGGSQVVFNCPRRMENERCPACEKADRLKASGKASDEAAAKELYASARNIAFAIDREDPDSGIQLMPFGTTVKKRLRHFREKLGKDFTSVEDGIDIVIERMGEGMNTEYQCDLGEQGPVHTDMAQFAKWAEELPDLKDFAKVLPYSTIVEKFAQAGLGGKAAGAQPRLQASSSVEDDQGDVDGGTDPF